MGRRRHSAAASIAGILTGLSALVTASLASADLSTANAPSNAPRTLSETVKWIASRTDPSNDTRSARAADDSAEQSTTRGHLDHKPPLVLLPSAQLATAPPAIPESATEAARSGSFARLRPSLVARDWSGAYAVVGKDLPSDNIRLTRSSRMLVSRMSLGDGRLQPFAHVAVGEWRYDPYLLPLMPHNQEYATQFSGGLSFELFKSTTLVWETDYTVLVRSSRDPQDHPAPHIIGTFAIVETRL